MNFIGGPVKKYRCTGKIHRCTSIGAFDPFSTPYQEDPKAVEIPVISFFKEQPSFERALM